MTNFHRIGPYADSLYKPRCPPVVGCQGSWRLLVKELIAKIEEKHKFLFIGEGVNYFFGFEIIFGFLVLSL